MQNTEAQTHDAAQAASPDVPATPFDALTDREMDVAVELAQGSRNAEIAKSFGISIKTVDTHRSHVLKKLHLRNNVDLARLAIKHGVAPL